MRTLSIAQVVPCTEAEGPGRRFALWFQGCPLRCPECCNPEMLPFEGGRRVPLSELVEQMATAQAESGVEGITLLGGEPLAHAADAAELARAARKLGLARANIGLLTDMIACPGGDFCSLANARSLPIAEAITQRYQDLDEEWDIGEIDLNISGCINSCGHHHAGHIGILGVDKDGKEWYQVTLGLCMLVGRFFLAIPVLAIAGSLVRKQKVPVTAGTFPTDTPLFAGLVLGVVIIVAGLTFLPVLALGPIVEHLSL